MQKKEEEKSAPMAQQMFIKGKMGQFKVPNLNLKAPFSRQQTVPIVLTCVAIFKGVFFFGLNLDAVKASPIWMV